MSTVARRWLYVLALSAAVVAWSMWWVVGVYAVDGDALLATFGVPTSVLDDVPANEIGDVGGAFGGVITTPIGSSDTAMLVAGVGALVLAVAMVVLRIWRAIGTLPVVIVTSTALAVAVDAAFGEHEPWIALRPLPTTVMVLSALVAFAVAVAVLVDAIRHRPARLREGHL